MPVTSVSMNATNLKSSIQFVPRQRVPRSWTYNVVDTHVPIRNEYGGLT